jgi:phospho-N-acetylmuramoyl-pentapeptide-transferase
MGLSALLGGIDDILNVFGHQRRVRSLRHVLVLARVHQSALVRLWYWFTIPFVAARSVVARFGSYSSRGVHVHEKLLLQFAAGAIAAWWIYTKLGDAWHVLDVPFVGDITIGWLTIPLVILVVMFTANAVNIADGMDGLAGGMLIPTFGALTLMSWLSSFNELALLNATVMGALISYTYFNIKPARFHMGDVGSLGLGALLAINAMAIGQTVSLILLGGLFYIEALSVIIQVIGRRVFGRRIFKMAPLHHHFEMIGWSEEKTIMRFWLVHFAMVLAGMWLWLVS